MKEEYQDDLECEFCNEIRSYGDLFTVEGYDIEIVVCGLCTEKMENMLEPGTFKPTIKFLKWVKGEYRRLEKELISRKEKIDILEKTFSK